MSQSPSKDSRSKRFLKGLFTGYVALGVNIVCTFASVPLALAYLTKEEFGLWALIVQFAGYLMLLELGMSGAIARFLSKSKDHMDDGEYGSVLLTGFVIFFLQGLVLLVLGTAFVVFAQSFLQIPSHLAKIFTSLGLIQVSISGISLMTRGFAAPLWPHQRLDTNNIAAVASATGSIITLWIGFILGWKLYSLAASALVGFLLGLVITVYGCFKLRLYPTKGHWGKFDAGLFRQMLGFGSGLFVLNLGNQLTSASQVLVISRSLGLEASSTWVVATKVSTVVQQFVNRIFETSAAGLIEMQVRQEATRLRDRTRDLVKLVGTLAGLGAVGIAMFNQPFLKIWTSGAISWPHINDGFLGIAVLLYCASRFFSGFSSLTQDVHKVKYSSLAEGLVFVISASVLSVHLGLMGVLIAAILSNLIINLGFSSWITSKRLNMSHLSVLGWLVKPALLTVTIILVNEILKISFPSPTNPWVDIFARASIYLVIVLPSFIYFGLTFRLRSEMLGYATKCLGTLKKLTGFRTV